jgi:dimethylargininase
MPVDSQEPAAANCVRAGDLLILPAGNPRTAERLRERGFEVVEVDVSELQKAEAGVTCMSLLDSEMVRSGVA